MIDWIYLFRHVWQSMYNTYYINNVVIHTTRFLQRYMVEIVKDKSAFKTFVIAMR